MKELSIEQKAKAYDEAIERAKEQLNDAKVFDYDNEQIAHDIRTTVYNIFPQLKESEDERIRKELIGFIKGQDKVSSLETSVYQSWLAWLEKQGNTDETINSNEFAQGVFPNILWHGGDEEPEEQCEILCEWESKDAVWHDVAFYHADTKTFWNGAEKIEAVVRWIYVNEILEKKAEQKPADRVEPKFKVGDWVVTSYGKVNQVIAVDVDGDGFTLDDYTYFSGSWKDNHHLWTIQDAKDGDVLVSPLRYGDGEQIFIFNSINSRDYVDDCIEYYCRVCEGVFYENILENENGYMGTTSSPLYPATKEQRDLLFQKMKEAGYEFDFEKKELKKIEQTPAWSEEDEIGLSDTLWAIKQARTIAKDENDMGNLWYAEKWLESLKDKVGCEVNCTTTKEWSEEDESMRRHLMLILMELGLSGVKYSTVPKYHFDREIEWLCNLHPQPKEEWSKKDEAIKLAWLESLFPQKQWKPSDEQIKVCKEVYADVLSAKGFDVGAINSELNRLEEQLKKLK